MGLELCLELGSGCGCCWGWTVVGAMAGDGPGLLWAVGLTLGLD